MEEEPDKKTEKYYRGGRTPGSDRVMECKRRSIFKKTISDVVAMGWKLQYRNRL